MFTTDQTLTMLGLDDVTTAFEPRLVTATLVAANADAALLRFQRNGKDVTGVMPVTEFYPNKKWEKGKVYTVMQMDDTARPLLSVTSDAFIGMLLEGVAPEVRDGRVRVMGVARTLGIRSKIAVAATEAGVDAVASCIGREANRAKYLRTHMHGERVDIVAWNADPETFVRNAFSQTDLLSVTFDGDGRVEVLVAPHHMAAALGGGGLNAALVSALTGFNVSVRPAA